MRKFALLGIAGVVLSLTACGSKAEHAVSNELQHENPSVKPPVESRQEETEKEDIAVESEFLVPDDETLVTVIDYIPTILLDLKYATEDNFTHTVIYHFSYAQLRYGTIKKLMQAQDELQQQGYGLKIWDAYRPVSAQFKLWEICPDPVYVANPNRGYSGHSRGNTIDVTLVAQDGMELEMPTGFDDFSTLADRDYSDVGEPVKTHVLLLEETMTSCGFKGYTGEWWHFTDTQEYAVIDESQAEDGNLVHADED